MAIREGRWDCDKCGTKGILGRHKECPQCGGQRPAKVRFYLPDGEPEVADPERLAEARAGADWTCEACGQDNPAKRTTCRKCGSPKDKSKSREIKDYGLEDIPRSGEPEEEPEEAKEEEPPDESGFTLPLGISQETASKIGEIISRIKVPAAVTTAVLAVAAATFMLFGTHPKDLTVTDHTWTRTVTIEEYRTVRETDWNIPAGGRYVSESEEIHHYVQVATGSHQEPYQDCHQEYAGTRSYTCGSRDLGNGYFEDITCTESEYDTVCTTEYRTVTDYTSVPVYETSYTYDIEKWVWDRDEKASGTGTSPYWPEFSLAANEREKGRQEAYTVHFTDGKEKPYKYVADYDTWLSLLSGETYTAKVNALGVVAEILGGK